MSRPPHLSVPIKHGRVLPGSAERRRDYALIVRPLTGIGLLRERRSTSYGRREFVALSGAFFEPGTVFAAAIRGDVVRASARLTEIRRRLTRTSISCDLPHRLGVRAR